MTYCFQLRKVKNRSLRAGSYNKKNIHVAGEFLKKDAKNEVIIIDLKELDIPAYDGDIETQGIPKSVALFAGYVADADAVIISTPEYNGSIPGPLKNLIDWVSRVRPMPWDAKPILLMGASPGMFGANRVLVEITVPLSRVAAHVFPKNFGLAYCDKAFDPNGKFINEGNQKRLETLLIEFYEFAKKFKH